MGYRVGVDIGGTFTDTVLIDEQDRILATTKKPTTPHNPTLGALKGAKRVLGEASATWGQV